MKLITGGRKVIQIDPQPFASGGQGSLHHVIGPVSNPAIVVKLYLTQQKALAAQKRIEYMSKNNPFAHSPIDIQAAFAWPLEAAYDATGNFMGFTMLLIKDAKPLWSLTIPKGFSDARFDKFNMHHSDSLSIRLKLLYNVCQALDILDRSKQYRVVDLKPVNMMLRAEGHIVVIDSDSFQISSGRRIHFHAEVATEEYCPPEYHHGQIDFTKQFVPANWDYFCFAIVAYQLLCCTHPFSGTHAKYTTQSELIKAGIWAHGKNKSLLTVIRPSHANFLLLSSALQNLFVRCFDNGHKCPNVRPCFAEWRDAFLTEINLLKTRKTKVSIGQYVKQVTKKVSPKQNVNQPTVPLTGQQLVAANIPNYQINPPKTIVPLRATTVLTLGLKAMQSSAKVNPPKGEDQITILYYKTG